MNKSFKASLSNGQLHIENLSNEHIENCFIKLTDIFYNDLISQQVTFKSLEKKSIGLMSHSFIHETQNESMLLRVYSGNVLLYQKNLNDKSKCFVLISNDKFEKLTEQLIIGLDRYSDEKIYHYTINYDSSLQYTNLQNIRMDVEGDTTDPQFMQFMKPRVFQDILKRGYKSVVFVDADIQIRSNIDKLFDSISEIEDGPIFQKSCWDFTTVGGMYIPGPLLSAAIGNEKQIFPYFITNIVVFNQTHSELFRMWDEVCQSEIINNIRKKEFMHDEVILNAMMWKLNIKPKLKWFVTNINNHKEVEFFYSHKNVGIEQYINLNDFGLGPYSQARIPYDKNEVLGFHCVKDPKIAEIINYIIAKNEITNYKELYQKHDEIESIINNKNSEVLVNCNFVDGAYIEIKCAENKPFRVEFWNTNNFCEYTTTIRSGMWTKTSNSSFEKWTCKVYDDVRELYSHYFDATNKVVSVKLKSDSIETIINWLPLIDSFRENLNCKLVCLTTAQNLQPLYPNIQFVGQDTVISNLYASYTLTEQNDISANIGHATSLLKI